MDFSFRRPDVQVRTGYRVVLFSFGKASPGKFSDAGRPNYMKIRGRLQHQIPEFFPQDGPVSSPAVPAKNDGLGHSGDEGPGKS